MWILWFIIQWVSVFAIVGVAIYFIWLHDRFGIYKRRWERAESLVYDDYRDSVWLKVGMLPSWLWFWFDDYKWMNISEGMNKRRTFILNRKEFWGGFEVLRGKSWYYWTLDYNEPFNNWVIKHIVDHIKLCEDGTIIGKFHLRVFGRLWFLAWFTMEAI